LDCLRTIRSFAADLILCSRLKNGAYHLADLFTVVDDQDALRHYFSGVSSGGR
jgi:hypothetical protein